jgi:four helix bundle protein
MTDHNLRERTFRFACRIVRLCRGLSAIPGIHRQLSSQLIRSGTSIGANLEEAKSARTRREFACKLGTVLRESRETLYWLRLVAANELANVEEVQSLISEADELVAIFTVAVRKARQPVNSKTSSDF